MNVVCAPACKGDAVEELADDAQHQEDAGVREGGDVVADALQQRHSSLSYQ
jgi:hypothetical protein